MKGVRVEDRMSMQNQTVKGEGATCNVEAANVEFNSTKKLNDRVLELQDRALNYLPASLGLD